MDKNQTIFNECVYQSERLTILITLIPYFITLIITAVHIHKLSLFNNLSHF